MAPASSGSEGRADGRPRVAREFNSERQPALAAAHGSCSAARGRVAVGALDRRLLEEQVDRQRVGPLGAAICARAWSKCSASALPARRSPRRPRAGAARTPTRPRRRRRRARQRQPIRHGSRTAAAAAVGRGVGSLGGPRPASQPAQAARGPRCRGRTTSSRRTSARRRRRTTASSVSRPMRSGVHGARRAAPPQPECAHAAASHAASSASDTPCRRGRGRRASARRSRGRGARRGRRRGSAAARSRSRRRRRRRLVRP